MLANLIFIQKWSKVFFRRQDKSEKRSLMGLFAFIFLFFSVQIVFAFEKTDPVIIEGLIKGSVEEKTVRLSRDIRHSITVSSDSLGLFRIDCSPLKNLLVLLSCDTIYTSIYANPGDSIFIEIDPQSSIYRFSGDHSDVNNYLFNRIQIERKIDREQLFSLSPSRFNTSLDSIGHTLRSYFQNNYSKAKDDFFQTEHLYLSFLMDLLSEEFYSVNNLKEIDSTSTIDAAYISRNGGLIIYPKFRGTLIKDFRKFVLQKAIEVSSEGGVRNYYLYICSH